MTACLSGDGVCLERAGFPYCVPGSCRHSLRTMIATSPYLGGLGGGGANAEVVAMNAKGGLTGDELGCFTVIMIAATIFLGCGWLLGELLFAPPHCGKSGCEAWTRELRLSTVSSLVGMGCLGLAAANKLPRLFLPLGSGILGITALASFGNPGAFILVGVDFILTMGVLGWLLVLWREG